MKMNQLSGIFLGNHSSVFSRKTYGLYTSIVLQYLIEVHSEVHRNIFRSSAHNQNRFIKKGPWGCKNKSSSKKYRVWACAIKSPPLCLPNIKLNIVTSDHDFQFHPPLYRGFGAEERTGLHTIGPSFGVLGVLACSLSETMVFDYSSYSFGRFWA